MEDKVAKVTDRLRGQCSRREYCVEDVRSKALKALDGDTASAEEVVQSLVRDKYVDDLRFASAFARDKASLQGWGEVKIRYMLSAKKISRDIIDAALSEIDQDKASSKLFKLVETKYKSLRDDPQCRLKLLRYALGRGYSYEDVNDLISQFMK